MILIFTYHRIIPTQPGGHDAVFYTITPRMFESQLQALRDEGFQFITPDLLRDGQLPAKPCLLTFDDGTQDHYDTVFPLLTEFRAPAIFFVCTAKLDRPGYLTRAQVRELAAAGHAIGCHAHQNRRLDVLSDEQLHQQIGESYRLITEITGIAPQYFAPPGGYSDGRVRAAAFAAGMDYVRTMRWGYNDQILPMALECIPVNRHITPAQFQDILHRRRATAMAFMYQTKETAKLLLPKRMYEHVRQFVGAVVPRK